MMGKFVKRNIYLLLVMVVNMVYFSVQLLYLELLKNEIQIDESKRKSIFEELTIEKF